MINQFTNTYDGFDASFEILFMLLGAFLLGYALRMLLDMFWNHHDSDLSKIISHNGHGEGKSAIYPMDNDEQDLKIVEGIGPKIEELLKTAGILNWNDLADSTIESLQQILEEGGSRFTMHNPETWPEQATLASTGHWSELEEYQDFLNGGKIQ